MAICVESSLSIKTSYNKSRITITCSLVNLYNRDTISPPFTYHHASPPMVECNPPRSLYPTNSGTRVPIFSTGKYTATGNGLPLTCWSSTLMWSWCLPLMVGWYLILYWLSPLLSLHLPLQCHMLSQTQEHI